MPVDPLTDEEIKALTEEGQRFEDTEVSQASRIFRKHLVPAAKTICDLAIHSDSERTRGKWAQYVVERGLGKIAEGSVEDEDPFLALLGDIVSENPEYAVAAARTVKGVRMDDEKDMPDEVVEVSRSEIDALDEVASNLSAEADSEPEAEDGNE